MLCAPTRYGSPFSPSCEHRRRRELNWNGSPPSAIVHEDALFAAQARGSQDLNVGACLVVLRRKAAASIRRSRRGDYVC